MYSKLSTFKTLWLIGHGEKRKYEWFVLVKFGHALLGSRSRVILCNSSQVQCFGGIRKAKRWLNVQPSHMPFMICMCVEHEAKTTSLSQIEVFNKSDLFLDRIRSILFYGNFIADIYYLFHISIFISTWCVHHKYLNQSCIIALQLDQYCIVWTIRTI